MHNHLPPRRPKILQIYTYITDGKTQQIFTISTHYCTGNLYKYQKSHENVEITQYCTGFVTTNTV